MKKHTKIYMDYFNFTIADFIPCEVCESKAVDIHHPFGQQVARNCGLTSETPYRTGTASPGRIQINAYEGALSEFINDPKMRQQYMA